MSDDSFAIVHPHAVSGRSNLKAILIVILSFAVFSGTDVLVKLLAERLPVAQVTCLVTAFALAFSLLQGLAGGQARDLLPRFPKLALVRAVLLSADTLLIYYAFSRLPLSDAYLLAFLTPILVAVLAAVLLGERLTALAWTGVVLGFCGVAVALRPGVQPLNLGHAAAVGAAICFSLSLILLRKTKAAESDAALMVTLMVMLVLISLMVTLLNGGFVALSLMDTALIALAGLLAFLGHFGLVRAFRMGDASVIAPFQYTQIIWGCVYGALVFGSPVETMTLLGAGVIILSGWLVLK